jgi:hypothetical protein
MGSLSKVDDDGSNLMESHSAFTHHRWSMDVHPPQCGTISFDKCHQIPIICAMGKHGSGYKNPVKTYDIYIIIYMYINPHEVYEFIDNHLPMASSIDEKTNIDELDRSSLCCFGEFAAAQ